jgi:hypothetical protein
VLSLSCLSGLDNKNSRLALKWDAATVARFKLDRFGTSDKNLDSQNLLVATVPSSFLFHPVSFGDRVGVKVNGVSHGNDFQFRNE